ncbi:hypothetical protein [Paracraurococcus lichenis]|uniref:Uncharacterized protein n=1 Tax=Paracraurococcus lichenis TaxID=3064888 RepID=A0ABT9DX49_9PROT|nr:hypothetical protein [Paracraurococcus sp. LOR1-02]MDO9708474.1 hypothetical protein [Paracraurococcus sp. LOR1-02]
MRSLLKLLVTLIVLGTAVQQGWLQAGTRFVAGLFGANPALVGEGGMDGLAIVQGLGPLMWMSLSGTLRNLPDPWYTLAVMTAGIVAVVLVVGILRTAFRATIRVTGWLRDVWV